ncbi:MAG TPA: lipopolysaccharide biosynthesis protein [Caldithrix abyssi]|uniref:Lipopolysaccharide biosynthesis protein n=1 Tax=Caldithrix abyssi TaxID=187145 RepID=A0A7V1LM53_CALAY|nr:lipopolysaccharide biosynthesis protein [Caldithrix abyssi]
MADNNPEEQSLTATARQGVIWTILRSLSSQGARFLASIFLARILFPEDFGIMGIVLIVTRFATRLGSFGFTQVLVQKKLIDETHIRTTFTVNLIIASLTTSILYVFAPSIASFIISEGDMQRLPLVTNVLRVLSLNFILIALYTVPNSLLKRKLKFKQESIIGIFAGVTKFLSPIAFALWGFGVWSLVFGAILGELMYVIAFYLSTKWVPRFGMNRVALRHIFSFGMWMNLYSYIQYFYKNIDYFLISKFLGLGLLGNYERAYNLMNTPRKRVGDMINGILFATYSKIQDEDERMNNAMRKVMGTVALIIFPAMTWLYFAAPSLIPLVYGDKWGLVVEPLQIMSISGLIESVTMVFYPAFIAKGLVKNRTRVHFVVFLFLATGLYFTAQISIVMVAWTIVGASTLGFFLNSLEYIRNTGWRWRDTFSSIRPPVIIMGLMIPALYGVRYGAGQWFAEDSPLMLIFLCIAAALVFFGSNYLFKFAEVKEIIALAKGKKPKKA